MAGHGHRGAQQQYRPHRHEPECQPEFDGGDAAQFDIRHQHGNEEHIDHNPFAQPHQPARQPQNACRLLLPQQRAIHPNTGTQKHGRRAESEQQHHRAQKRPIALQQRLQHARQRERRKHHRHLYRHKGQAVHQKHQHQRGRCARQRQQERLVFNAHQMVVAARTFRPLPLAQLGNARAQAAFGAVDGVRGQRGGRHIGFPPHFLGMFDEPG